MNRTSNHQSKKIAEFQIALYKTIDEFQFVLWFTVDLISVNTHLEKVRDKCQFWWDDYNECIFQKKLVSF